MTIFDSHVCSSECPPFYKYCPKFPSLQTRKRSQQEHSSILSRVGHIQIAKAILERAINPRLPPMEKIPEVICGGGSSQRICHVEELENLFLTKSTSNSGNLLPSTRDETFWSLK